MKASGDADSSLEQTGFEPSPAHSGAATKLVQEALCDFQIGCLEALGKSIVDPPKERARFFGTALVAPHPREAGGGA
jgi:hypothetical protein